MSFIMCTLLFATTTENLAAAAPQTIETNKEMSQMGADDLEATLASIFSSSGTLEMKKETFAQAIRVAASKDFPLTTGFAMGIQWLKQQGLADFVEEQGEVYCDLIGKKAQRILQQQEQMRRSWFQFNKESRQSNFTLPSATQATEA